MLNCAGDTVRALMRSAGMPFNDLILSQQVACPLDASSFRELGGIKIELDITEPSENQGLGCGVGRGRTIGST